MQKNNPATWAEAVKGVLWLFYRPAWGRDPEIADIGGRWDVKRNAWRLPYLKSTLARLEALVGDPIEHAATVRPLKVFQYGFPIRKVPVLNEGMAKSALSYQLDAISFIINSPHHAGLIALSPGLGKTFTAIAIADALKAQKVLVIASPTLIFNWVMQINEWTGETAENCHKQAPSSGRWTIANIETVLRDAWRESPKKGWHFEGPYFSGWDLVIFDESIMLQSNSSKRTKGMVALRSFSRYTLFLSGMPVTKFYDDLWGQFAGLMPRYFTSYWQFVRQYCNTRETKYGTQIVSDRRGIVPGEEFSDIMFVRSHEQVKAELPQIIHERIFVEMTEAQAERYFTMSEAFIADLESDQIVATTVAVQLIRLAQIVSNLANLSEYQKDESGKLLVLEQLLTDRSYRFPMIVWTHWKQSAYGVKRLLDRMGISNEIIIGDIAPSKRGDPIKRYMAGQVDVLVISLGTGKHGLTLLNTETAIYYDKIWDSDAYVQSLSRIAGRIGATHSPIAVSLHCSGTMDDVIEANLRGKIKTIAKVTNRDLATLLKGLRSR